MTKTRLLAATLAVSALTGLTACAGSTASSSPSEPPKPAEGTVENPVTAGGYNDNNWEKGSIDSFWVKLPTGKSVLCVSYQPDTHSGSLTCDWKGDATPPR